MVWGRPAAASQETDAATAPAPQLSRRAARARRAATGEQPVIADAPESGDPESTATAPSAGLADAVVAETFATVLGAEPVHGGAPVATGPTIDPVLIPAEPFELIEPSAEPTLEPKPEAVEPAHEAPVEASGVDAFAAAARLFAFTGETPVQPASEAGVDATPAGDETEATDEESGHVAGRRARVSRAAIIKRIAATSFSIGAFGVVGLLTVGMTTPVAAVAAAQGTAMTTTDITTRSTSVLTAAGNVDVDPDEIQAYVAPAEIENATLDREENYATVSMTEVASELGIVRPSSFYVNDPNAAIQWPFAVGVGITFGFGMRDGRMHEGADFVPGNGARIQAIADGTVRTATESGGAYGVQVVIDHVIDGQLISTRYAHMQYGSLQVVPGQQVTVGTFLGRTGNTGRSFGAHLHFEVLAGGDTAIDPIAWLRNNAGRDALG